ncbi:MULTISPECIES: 3-phosphoshikimate 1-carboxyvinyltransferase [unclassified Treponema]|uniref:3-phosphoshikimate 1-carboxyvinyltransferase n=1 Tax=unclassified Treponema TaxID=2638727 RepID=UPI0020A59DC6|nr:MULTISPECIES: 3-phosphoshikimate 1-carboxyvinyltransferase [unclassified Treponema]UTC67975.1 3-phosphoshikimate 1-carboxyvinyltransferase [Treponema sp. OMZ 789]UTC70698.1 3-phosphoshikimate 1-carboxyvinyltransferase [Treponema sp. OMZ 790]UTC73419.1 3-phosphoshikimate 1-carboxyvinyltransferase [Treponema sp. OMZ 791]
MILKIKKSSLFSPQPIEVPPSKSHSMRALVLSSFAEGSSEIKNFLMSGDTKTALSVFKSLGVKFKIEQKTKSSADILVFPPKEGLKKRIEKQKSVKIDTGNSGTLFYFLGSILSLISSDFVLTGDSSILKRPVKPLTEIYEGLGLKYEFLNSTERAPIRVLDAHIKGKEAPISRLGETSLIKDFEEKKLYLAGDFSQVVSGLLLGGALTDYSLQINLKRAGELPYLKMTLYWLKTCGIEFIVSDDFKTFKIAGGQKIPSFSSSIPGDWSSSAFPIALSLITASPLSIKNIDINDVQGDARIVEILKEMNADIRFEEETQTLKIYPSSLKGGVFDCSDIPDAVPALSAISCFAKGETLLKNIEICRYKECDRISAIVSELTKLGADITEGKDFLLIRGIVGKNLKPAKVFSHGDHRIAMMLAVIGAGIDSKDGSDFILQDAQCFDISYPSFLEELKNIGVNITADK